MFLFVLRFANFDVGNERKFLRSSIAMLSIFSTKPDKCLSCWRQRVKYSSRVFSCFTKWSVCKASMAE